MLSFDCRVSRITQSLKIHSMRHQMGDHQWIGYLWGGCCYKSLMTCWVILGQGRAVHFSSAFIRCVSLAVVLKFIEKVF